jgi:hypothetical protein
VQLQRQVESPHVEKSWKDNEGRRWLKVYIGDTDYINNNGWGYSDKEVLDNLNATGIDSPGLLTDYIYHPISAIRAHDSLVMAGGSPEQVIAGIQRAQEQEGKVIWRHKSFYRDKDNSKRIYSNVEVTDADAIKVIDEGIVPKFVSSSAYLYDQPTGKGISKKLHYLHTAIVKKPAFPFAHAIIKASCIGDEGKCNQSLAVAGILTEIPQKQSEEWCNLCTGGKLRDIAKEHTSILRQNLVIASSDLSQEEPNVKDPQEENNNKKPAPEEEAKTSKAAVKVTKTETVQNNPNPLAPVPTDQQQEGKATPTSQEEILKAALGKIEEQGKVIEQLKAKDTQREIEKRRNIIASYINKVFEHEDDKTREEKIGKYLTGSYLKLTDEELVEFLKDKYGEQLVEVAPGKTGKNSKGKAAYAGIDEYITKTADMSGTSTGKKSYPLLNFSSYIEETEGVML